MIENQTNEDQESQGQTDGKKRIKIQLDDEWHIPVDEQGYVVGDIFEGALGYVLRLYSNTDTSGFRAMKLPRLVADTVQENAYIVEMHDTEVETVLNLEKGKYGAQGLLSLAASNQNVFASFIKAKEKQVIAHDDEGRYPVILFCFQKNKRLRMCRCMVPVSSRKDGKLEVTPPFLGKHLNESTLKKTLEKTTQIAKEATKKNEEDPGVVAISILPIPRANRQQEMEKDNAQTAHETPERGPQLLSRSLHKQDSDEIWYAFLPSVTFRWANTTLQRAISNDERGTRWTLAQHISLGIKILEGLDTLHSCGKLHGDIRPANVMCVGNPQSPEAYVLGDYGSFCFDRPRLGQKGGGGETIVGSKLTSDRASPFYARERRGGAENEAADCAVVLELPEELGPEAKDYYVIRLGWQQQLMADGKLDDQIRKDTLKCVWYDQQEKKPSLLSSTTPQGEVPTKTSQDMGILKGDRVRLRDYLFVVEEAGFIDRDRLLLCWKPFWRVLHDSLVVPNREEPHPEGDVINLSAVTEFQSWSAATDVYGVGAVLLYSIFRSNGGESGVDDVRDLDFWEMMANLESPSYFRTVWKRLEELKEKIEKAFKTRQSGEVLSISAASNDKGEENLGAEAMVTVNNIIKTAPGTRRLFFALDRNLSAFVFILHFALSCIHRQSSLNRVDEIGQEAQEKAFPFCKDRLEPPKEEGVAHKAREHLKDIDAIHQQDFLKDFQARKEQVAEYKPTDPLFAEYKADQLQNQLGEAESKADQLQNQLGEAESKADQLQNQLGEAESKADQLQNQLGEAESKADQLQNQLGEAESKANQLQNQLGEAESKADQLQNQLGEAEEARTHAESKIENILKNLPSIVSDMKKSKIEPLFSGNGYYKADRIGKQFDKIETIIESIKPI